MPSGYTASVNDGTVTELEPFLLSCARAFGACIMQRDDPASEPPKPQPIDSFHLRARKDAEKKLVLLEKMTVAEASQHAKLEHENALKDYQRTIDRNHVITMRYQNMIKKVQGWVPPSPDHEGLKKFMWEQLTESLKWDIYKPTVPVLRTGKTWLKDNITSALKNIEYHTNEYQEEVKRTTSRNEWIAKLYDSLQ